MYMLNHISIMGRLTKDVELRRTNTGTAVASFTLAVDRDFSKEKETDFIDCVAWKNTAEFVSKYFSRGKMAIVSGRLQIRSWTDKDGNNRRTAEVVAENVYFGEAKTVGDKYEAAMATNTQLQDFAVVDGDDDTLPF
jgi:single-strand DNA-binding protein